MDDFKSFDRTKWGKSAYESDVNLSDVIEENVYVEQGKLVLRLNTINSE